jgi:hypothetical protein
LERLVLENEGMSMKWSWIAGVLVLAAWSVRADDGWEVVTREQGVVVSVREQPGTSFPVFRGEGAVQGPLLHVLAVVLDGARAHEWSDDADENAVLRTIDARTHVVYSRSHQRWPVRDRDLVMRRTVEVLEAEQAFRVRMVCVRGDKPKLKDVIRIEDCETTFVLRKLDDRTTHVEYKVRVDPGGSNPDWLVRAVSQKGPLDTIVALRRQVARTRGQYDAAMRAWASAS